MFMRFSSSSIARRGSIETPNPLSLAINKSNRAEVEAALKQGFKLEISEFYPSFVQVFERNTINPEIIDLLGTYQALPPNVSIATIKLILFLEGNDQIQIPDFLNKPGLNLSGCPGLQTPMQIATRTGSERNVRFLIEAGVKDRPYAYLFASIHESHFQGLDLLNINEFKSKITTNLAGGEPYLPRELEGQCRITELFLKNPNESLYTEIEADAKVIYSKYRMLPYLAWVAKNNRADLFESEGFVRLFLAYPKAALWSLKIAVAFGAKEYVKIAITLIVARAMFQTAMCIAFGAGNPGVFAFMAMTLMQNMNATVRMVMSVACASGDQAILACIVNTLQEQFKLTLYQISHQSITRGDPLLGTIGEDEPLFWAISTKNAAAVEFLLQNGIDPNGDIHAFSGDSYLHLAIRMGNKKIIQHLLDKGANVDCANFLKKTPLHEALERKQYDIAFMLVRDYHADHGAIDNENKTPLDYVRDEDLRNKLLSIAQLTNFTPSRPRR